MVIYMLMITTGKKPTYRTNLPKSQEWGKRSKINEKESLNQSIRW